MHADKKQNPCATEEFVDPASILVSSTPKNLNLLIPFLSKPSNRTFLTTSTQFNLPPLVVPVEEIATSCGTISKFLSTPLLLRLLQNSCVTIDGVRPVLAGLRETENIMGNTPRLGTPFFTLPHSLFSV